MNKNLVCSFDLIPGLVIEYLGQPAVVIANDRDIDREVAHVTVNTPDGDQRFSMSWAQASSISVIGVAVHAEPDNIVLFDE